MNMISKFKLITLSNNSLSVSGLWSTASNETKLVTKKTIYEHKGGERVFLFIIILWSIICIIMLLHFN